MPDAPFTHLVTSEEELRGVYAAPPARAWMKEIDALDEHCAAFLARAPFAMLATSGADGRTTVTPRGGPPGFLRVLDPHRLAWADLTGNRRVDAFRHILENPEVGLLVLLPGMRETLRIDGTAYLTRDPSVPFRGSNGELTGQGERCRGAHEDKTPTSRVVVRGPRLGLPARP